MTAALKRRQVWTAPLLLGASTVAGLVAALFSDRGGDWLAWLALAAPILAVVWYSARPQRP